jgi:hypothetical protein
LGASGRLPAHLLGSLGRRRCGWLGRPVEGGVHGGEAVFSYGHPDRDVVVCRLVADLEAEAVVEAAQEVLGDSREVCAGNDGEVLQESRVVIFGFRRLGGECGGLVVASRQLRSWRGSDSVGSCCSSSEVRPSQTVGTTWATCSTATLAEPSASSQGTSGVPCLLLSLL